MASLELKIPCQRCGEQMEMKDPAPGDAWRPDQFWVCPRCSRHFWSTYPARPGQAATVPAPAATATASAAAPPSAETAPKP